MVGILSLAGLVGTILHWQKISSSDQDKTELRVLAYSSFTAAWGPGPELAEMFELKMRGEGLNAKVILLQAEDAGLLLAKMNAFPADVVLGFDQLGVKLAKKKKEWRPHHVKGVRFSDAEFLAFDWAPLGFIYRKGEIEPPKDLEDLLDVRFQDTIALQDPRSSSPGFQFLNWLVRVKGEDEAFRYLAKLKPNVQSTSGSWSQAYGMFTRGLAKLTFSYATSVLYHRLSEKDDRYEFAKFPTAHPVQIEFAAISATCRECGLAEKFMAFLVEEKSQAVVMSKNWMLPVQAKAAAGTAFEALTSEGDRANSNSGLKLSPLEENFDPRVLLQRWAEVGL